MIYNKSAHPVEVKKISVRIWTLRAEIEAAIERRMKECEAAGIPLYIDDIKKFYNLNRQDVDHSNVVTLPTDQGKEDDLNNLMESLGKEAEPVAEETTPLAEEATPVAEETTTVAEETTTVAEEAVEESKTLNEAEEIIADQKLQGLDTDKPNPILDRPYQCHPPDLEKISYGFSLLSDLNMDVCLAFIKDEFLQGQSVIIEFLIPQTFKMTAQVIYCSHYARTSKIISSVKPDYRVQCKFGFQMTHERDNLRNFLKSVQPKIPEVRIRPKKKTEDDYLGF
jgi:hypothetical protein